MSQDQLGLFDTPPDRQEIRFSSRGCRPADRRPPPAYCRCTTFDGAKSMRSSPSIDAFMFFTELIIATLLYAQAGVFRSRALTVLATGYVFAATDSHTARADLSRRFYPERTAWRRDQHDSVDRSLPADGVSHCGHSLCLVSNGRIRRRSLDMERPSGEDHLWGHSQQLPWPQR